MAKHIYKPEGASEKSRLSFSSISSRAALLRSASSQWANPRSWKTLNTIHGPVHVVKAVVSNLKSAVLVAMVSVPLSIGLGIASGASPTAGLRTAIWGGLICGLFGSSPFNVIGPAGALTGMLSTYSAQWGEDILPWIALFSGIFVTIIVSLRLQRYCLFMPKSVFEGFTLAVALIIGLKQINYALGLRGLHKHENFLENLWESLSHIGGASWGSMVLFFPELIVLAVLVKYAPRVPWMVVIPLCTILLGYFFEDPASGWELPTLKTEFGALPNAVAVLPDPGALRSCSSIFSLLVASASVALVAVLETLISAKIADFRAAENACGPFDEGREVAALALAQMLCGATGALPPTGVFVRTSVNQLNGASHGVSQAMNALLVLVVTASAMPVFSYLPLASVAAVLVLSAVRMVPVDFMKHLWRHARAHFVLCLLTASVCVALDPVVGLLAGTLAAYLIAAMNSSNAPDAVVVTSVHIEGVVGPCRTVAISGAVTYANADAITRRGAADEAAPAGAGNERAALTAPSIALLDLARVTEMDTDGAEAVERLAVLLGRKVDCQIAAAGAAHVFVCAATNASVRALESTKWFADARAEGRVCVSREDALAAHMRMARESSVVDRSVENASPSSDGAPTHVVLSVKLNDPEDLTGDELTTGERALSAEEREASTLYP